MSWKRRQGTLQNYLGWAWGAVAGGSGIAGREGRRVVGAAQEELNPRLNLTDSWLSGVSWWHKTWTLGELLSPMWQWILDDNYWFRSQKLAYILDFRGDMLSYQRGAVLALCLTSGFSHKTRNWKTLGLNGSNWLGHLGWCSPGGWVGVGKNSLEARRAKKKKKKKQAELKAIPSFASCQRHCWKIQ